MSPELQNVSSMVIAALLGAAIGAEREWRRHPGGLRSCALVTAAACLFARIAVTYGGSNPGAALGAIATGIGFLGAGVILHQGGQVRDSRRQRHSGRWRRSARRSVCWSMFRRSC